MTTTVLTLYDFEGNPGTDELSFVAGEVLTVTNTDVGEGWWEGRKSDGSIGLFPQSYVEERANVTAEHGQAANSDEVTYEENPPQAPADEYIAANESEQPTGVTDTNKKTWEGQGNTEASEDNWSDDWNAIPASTQNQASLAEPDPIHLSPSSDGHSPVRRNRNTTVKTGKHLFSTFTKTAGESYILGETKFDVKGMHMNRIILCDEGPMWESSPNVFSCTVSDPVKESKFSGFKSFIAYNITPSHTDKSVLRRFKHFDWLYEQLSRKFGVSMAVPLLPDKQLTGRYENDFIEERRSQLEAWISRMGLHPIISRSEVLLHFVTSNDDEKAWKAGKRKAEKDEAVGGTFLNTVETPEQPLDLNLAEQTLETHLKFTKGMEESCKHLVALGTDQVKKYTSVSRKDYEKLGQSFQALSESFALDERPVATPLTQAMKHTGDCFNSIGELYNEQPRYDWNPFLTGVNEYKCVLSTFPGILANQKSALEKNKEVRRLQLENKVTSEEMEDASARTEKLSYAVQAEMNHFQHYRVGDFAVYMKNFLHQQIAFHKEIVKKLEEAHGDYQDMVEQ